MKKIPSIALMFLMLAACHTGNNRKDMNGGPCSYQDKIFPARLLKLVPVDSTLYDASFAVSGRRGADDTPDTLYFHQLTNNYIQATRVKTDSIEAGKIYRYVRQTIVSGDCNPNIETIRLEKFE